MRTIRPYHLEHLSNGLNETQAKNAKWKKWRPANRYILRLLKEKVGAAPNDKVCIHLANNGYRRFVRVRFNRTSHIFMLNFDKMNPLYKEGLPLAHLNAEPLYPVPASHSTGEIDSPKPGDLVDFCGKLEHLRSKIEEDTGYKLEKIEPHRLRPKYFKAFSFDEKTKLYCSSIIMMGIDHQYAERRCDDAYSVPKPHYALVHKIKSSQWRYGYGSDWNTLAAAYTQIPKFDFGIADFTVKLDMTTSYNEAGYSTYTNTYLDGPLAYLIYYQGKHVMTIGFSISTKMRLLINQVQLKNKKGNRWLYQLPMPHLDYALQCMQQTFSNFSIYLVDGGSLAARIKKSYGNNPKLQEAELQEREVALNRVKDFYTRPLKHYKRGDTIRASELSFTAISSV